MTRAALSSSSVVVVRRLVVLALIRPRVSASFDWLRTISWSFAPAPLTDSV